MFAAARAAPNSSARDQAFGTFPKVCSKESRIPSTIVAVPREREALVCRRGDPNVGMAGAASSAYALMVEACPYKRAVGGVVRSMGRVANGKAWLARGQRGDDAEA